MTREEIIKGYTNNQKKSTWEQLGSNVITSNTKLYNKGMVYQVKVDNAPLFDCLIFCREDHIGGLNWTQGNIIDSFSGEISFGNNIIDPNLIVIMSKADFDEADASAVPSDFVPFSETLKEETDNVIISDSDYHYILSVLGYPYVTEEELEYSRQEIITYAVKPSLELYYRYFPRRETKTYPTSAGIQEVEFPDKAYDILGFSIQQAGGTLDSNGNYSGEVSHTLWRYWDILPYIGGGCSAGGYSGGYAGMTGTYNSIYPPKTQQSSMGSLVSSKAAIQSYLNYSHRYRIDKILKTDADGNSKYYAKFYSNKLGSVAEITWAVQDRDVGHIDYARRQEFFKVAQANVKLLFANLRSQAKPISGNITDWSSWKQEANEAIKEVTSRWDSITKYSSAVRGSL